MNPVRGQDASMGGGQERHDATVPFFEGTEKKVELLIDPSAPSLRARGEQFWTRIVARSGAQILSRLANDVCNAYLLSESSLFVYDHKMIMITCGRTRLPEAVVELLNDLPEGCVEFFIYERKNEVFPHDQPTSFDDDVKRLGARLPGRAFRFGPADEHHLKLFHLDRPFRGVPRDLTLEILMYGLGPRSRAHFDPLTAGDPDTVRTRSGLDRLLPGFLLDDHLFRPSGYSLNAVRDDLYWTVHVTPQPASSYASFETNYRFDGAAPGQLIESVLEIFDPRSFDLVVFHQQAPLEFCSQRYRMKSHVARDLECGYDVQFMSYYLPQASVTQAVELPTA